MEKATTFEDIMKRLYVVEFGRMWQAGPVYLKLN